MSKNMKKPGGGGGGHERRHNMAPTSCMLDKHGYTRKYIIFIAFPRQQRDIISTMPVLFLFRNKGAHAHSLSKVNLIQNSSHKHANAPVRKKYKYEFVIIHGVFLLTVNVMA
jgi:hypothetical protein